MIASAEQTERRAEDQPSGQSTIRNSPSVDDLANELRPGPPVTSWEIAQSLIGSHGYARSEWGDVPKDPDLTDWVTRPVDDWIRLVRESLDPDQMRAQPQEEQREGGQRVVELHGKLLVVGLSKLDPDLATWLSTNGFLEALRGAVWEQPVDLLFRTADPTSLHLDDPAIVDELGRQGFARSLARRLARIWNEYRDSQAQSSFMLHLDGRWGSGKSTLLNLLRQELRPEQPGAKNAESATRPAAAHTPTQPKPTEMAWVVVDFNAWQHQRLDPPWWSLMDAVYRQGHAQTRGRPRGQGHAFRIWAGEQWWRFVTARQDLLLAGILVTCLLLFVASVVMLSPNIPLPELTQFGDTAESVTAVLSLVGTVLTACLLVSRSLLSGSMQAAQTFVQSASDPMERVRQRFHQLVATIGQPIVIFVDDLDRCQSAYVVSLLEGIQTLFNDPRVIYVVAADGRWLHCAFEQSYEPFAANVREPGRRLGSLFLDKAFEISVSVPTLFPESKDTYWKSLIRHSRDDVKDQLAAARRKAEQEFSTGTSGDQAMAQLKKPGGTPIEEQARRDLVVELLASREAEASTRYFLAPFAPLIEANPRSMKRLINTYTMQRDLAILSRPSLVTDVKRRQQLVLWTIVKMRWPVLEEYLMQRAGKMADDPSDEVRHLFTREDVRRVLTGGALEIEVALDEEAIGLFVGLEAQPASPDAMQ